MGACASVKILWTKIFFFSGQRQLKVSIIGCIDLCISASQHFWHSWGIMGPINPGNETTLWWIEMTFFRPCLLYTALEHQSSLNERLDSPAKILIAPRFKPGSLCIKAQCHSTDPAVPIWNCIKIEFFFAETQFLFLCKYFLFFWLGICQRFNDLSLIFVYHNIIAFTSMQDK